MARTILELRTAIAGFLQRTTTDFTVGGVDLLTLGINMSKRWAQQNCDFEYCRKQVQISMNLTTGSDISTIVEQVTGTAVDVKRIEGGYVTALDGTTRPIDFVGVRSTIEDIQRSYDAATDGVFDPASNSPLVPTSGFTPVLAQKGSILYLYPDSTLLFGTGSVTMLLDVIAFLADYGSSGLATVSSVSSPAALNATWIYLGVYNNHALYYTFTSGVLYLMWNDSAKWIISVANDLTTSPTNYFSLISTADSPAGTYAPHGTFTGTPTVALSSTNPASDWFLNHGFEFLMWKTICDFNYLWQEFVPRQEGKLSAPTTARDQAWANLIAWNAGVVDTGTESLTLE